MGAVTTTALVAPVTTTALVAPVTTTAVAAATTTAPAAVSISLDSPDLWFRKHRLRARGKRAPAAFIGVCATTLPSTKEHCLALPVDS